MIKPHKETVVGYSNELKNIISFRADLICFGELKHGENEELFGKLPYWGKQITGVFLEIPIDYQDEIDEYLKIGRFNKKIEGLLQGAEKEGKSLKRTFQLILEYAKENKLPVICVDSSKTKHGEYSLKCNYYYLKSDSRDGDMYERINEIINKNGGKWFFLGGASHLDYAFCLNNNLPSLGKRLKSKMNSRVFTILLAHGFKEKEGNLLLSYEINENLIIPIPGKIDTSFDAVLFLS